MQKESPKTTTPEHASNPAPGTQPEPKVQESILGDKAEKYLREGGNIEDLPDADERAEAEEQLSKDDEE